MDSEVNQLHARATCLPAQFGQEMGACYIDEAINLDRASETLELCPTSHPKRSVSLTWFAIHSVNPSYNKLGATKDLEEVIVLGREGLEPFLRWDPNQSVCLDNLAQTVGLSARYGQLEASQDLDRAIDLDRGALRLCPQGHPGRSMFLNNLAIRLSFRYNQLGPMRDLDEAIALGQEALKLCRQGHRDRSLSLNNLAFHLSMRYKQLGIAQDLDEAIILGREALELHSPRHPSRPTSLINLAVDLSARYNQLGATQDLDEAIVLDREALKLCPQGHPYRFMPLNNLTLLLSTRYNQLRAMQDLDEAILLDREALELHAGGHSDRSASLINLAVHLSVRYNQLGKMQDLDEAIVLGREALELCLQEHPARSMSLNNLTTCLSTRFRQLGVLRDLDEIIVLDRKALELQQQGHPDRSKSLNNLAVHLSTRYNRREKMLDLDEAIVCSREALELCPQGHPSRSRILQNLADYHCNRFAWSKQSKDKEEVFSLYLQLVDVTQVVSSTDLSASRAWISVAEHFQHPVLLLAYGTSLRLLAQYLTALPSLPQRLVIPVNLISSLIVDALSACLRRNVPSRAVELLEQGRSIFWGRLHSPLDDVIASGAAGRKLADEFVRLVSLIRNVFNSPGTDQHERVCRHNLEMQNVVASIRQLPGLSRFLLPSLFSDLQLAASDGPVIIVNASQYSCDALVVLLHQDPVHIPLQITQGIVRDLSTELHALTRWAKRGNVTRELAFFLRKLWIQIVSPIVEFLQTILPSQSRIWWCPTADFSVLPLHAAGPYRKSQQNLPDLYISSYTPTLATLIRARRRDPSKSPTEGKRFIAIGQAKAPGERELLSVGTELDMVGQLVGGLATFTRIDGEESCISRVVEELGKNEWVHLACNSFSNPTHPFDSAFTLHDGHLTIQRIIKCDLQNQEFAYLSACHTAVGYEESLDLIHLASAMQFAGFRSVIGTMGSVDDGETNKITSTFYKHMVDESGRLDHTRAAFALNRTMKSVNIPLDQQIFYIHIGA